MNSVVTAITAIFSVTIPLKPNLDYTYPHFCSKADPDFKEIRYESKVAVCGRMVNPSTKHAIFKKYGIPKENQGEYTIDHFIPLSLGGSNEPQNLWPQHKSISTADLEFETMNRLKAGQISHQEALNIIITKKVGKP